MSFKMIREAQAIARLGDKAEFAKKVQTILGTDSVVPIAEIFDQKEFEVTPQHYTQWLETLLDVARERGVNVNRKQDFNEIAFEILDNDSLVDALGGDSEATKRNILKALWQSYQVSKAHTRVQDHVSGVIDRTREEEEAVDQLVGSECEEESGFSQAMKLSTGVEQEEQSYRLRKPPIYRQALRKGKKNPYPAGSLRAALWDDAHGSEDEEIDDELPEDLPPEDAGTIDQSEVDTASLSPDELASHITRDMEPEADMDAEMDEPETPDLEARVDDLEDRIADLEHTDAEDVTDGDEFVDAVEPETAVPMREPEVEPARTRSRANVVEPGFDEEEQVKTLFRKAITSPKEHLSAALKDVEQEGSTAWAKLQLPVNPHPKKSPAYNAWVKGFKTMAKNSLGFVDKPSTSTSKQKPKKR